MVAPVDKWPLALERMIGKLTDAALEVILRQGVRQTSVEIELALWKSLGELLEAVRRESAIRADDVAARLATTAYQVALAHHPRGTFLDLEVGLWQRLRRVLRDAAKSELDLLDHMPHVPLRLNPASRSWN